MHMERIIKPWNQAQTDRFSKLPGKQKIKVIFFIDIFYTIKYNIASQGLKLKSKNFQYCYFLYIFIHYSFIFVLIFSFMPISIFKSETFKLFWRIFKDGYLQKLRKKYQKSMNNERKSIKITIMKVSSLKPRVGRKHPLSVCICIFTNVCILLNHSSKIARESKRGGLINFTLPYIIHSEDKTGLIS